MRNLIVTLFCFVSNLLLGQVTGVDYLMKYNCETNQYDVNIVVLGGSATSVPHRAQFNSQISIVVPTSEALQITDMYMPLENNINYEGTVPLTWTVGIPIISPEVQLENDFYWITPTLSPASFYNDLETGEIVKVFSFTAGTTGQYNESVRFFINDEDPKSNEPGMGGGDFSNSFTIGSPNQIYHSNTVESCITNAQNTLPIIANIYPNPFQNHFTVELPNDVKQISVIGATGEVYYHSESLTNKVLTINAFNYTSGAYFILMELNDGTIE